MYDFLDNVSIQFAHYRACSLEWSWIPKKNNWQGYMLWLVLEGQGSVKKPGKSGYTKVYSLEPGSCLAYRMDQDYLVEHNKENPLSIFGVYFKLYDAMGRILNLSCDILPEYLLLDDFSLLKRLMKRTVDLFLQKDGEKDLINTYFKAAVVEYMSTPRLQQKGSSLNYGSVGQLIALLKRHPKRHYSLEEIAQHLKCSKNSAMRLIKRKTGLTPMVLQNSVKIELAREFLHTSNLSIAELSDELGYSDPYYFSKVFKQITGIPPGQYRGRGINASKLIS